MNSSKHNVDSTFDFLNYHMDWWNGLNLTKTQTFKKLKVYVPGGFLSSGVSFDNIAFFPFFVLGLNSKIQQKCKLLKNMYTIESFESIIQNVPTSRSK